MKKLWLVLAFIAVFAAGFATHRVVSRMCGGGSCDRHARMDCCKKDGSCERHATEGCCKGGTCERHAGADHKSCCKKTGAQKTSAVDSTEIKVPGAAGEKACCKKKHD